MRRSKVKKRETVNNMKLLFTDLDGTLLNNESRVSDGTMAFLEDFFAAGNKLILSSGRPLDSILEVMADAGLDYSGIFLICYNGTLVYDCDNRKPVLEKRLPLAHVAYLQRKAEEHGLHIQTYTDDSVVCTSEDPEIRFYRRKIHLPLLLAKDYASFLEKGPCKMLVIHLTEHERLVRFRDDIAAWADGKIQAVFSNDQYLELFHKDGGKGNAVKFVCDYFNVPLSDTYAAGDADNDISMLEAAGTGIAMLNSSEKVKKHADVITELDNDNDGLALMMQKLLI